MISIVHELRRARGGNKKLDILRRHRDNKDWKRVLLAMYDSSINYYTGVPGDKTFVDGEINVDSMLYNLGELSNRTYTGNAAREVAMEGSQEFGEIYRLILGGSLKAGVSVTSINKIYDNLIPTFDVMLAQDVEDVRYPLLASTKYDGVRLIAFVFPDKSVELRTRQGKELVISSLIIALCHAKPGVYDGELVSGDGLQAGRTTITGQVNKCMKGTSTDISGYTFAVFDFVPLEAWERKQCTWIYQQRHEFLSDGLPKTSNIILAPQYMVNNDDEVEDMFKDHLARGYEGLILRDENDPYVWKRSSRLIKRKAIKEATLKCVGTTNGTGKYEGMIGALMCRGVVEDKVVDVMVGSGLSDHDRDKLEEDYYGKNIEVLYNDITQAKGSTSYSLFLPRFKRMSGAMSV